MSKRTTSDFEQIAEVDGAKYRLVVVSFTYHLVADRVGGVDWRGGRALCGRYPRPWAWRQRGEQSAPMCQRCAAAWDRLNRERT